MVVLAAVLVLSLATGNIQIHSPDRAFQPIYLLKRNQTPRKYVTSLLVQNSSGQQDPQQDTHTHTLHNVTISHHSQQYLFLYVFCIYPCLPRSKQASHVP